MYKDLGKLRNTSFDVVFDSGGVHGGAPVAARTTSANSLKIVHGGETGLG